MNRRRVGMACLNSSIVVRTKGDEMELIVQLLLESRTGAYIEWLDNKLIMADNNNINKDSLLVLLSVKKKPANHKASHIP